MEPNLNDRQFRATAPYFVVRNLKEPVTYYHRALGFNMPEPWGEPPSFAIPSRDDFIIMLKQAEQGIKITTSRD